MNTDKQWTGCGDCDSSFPCYGGEKRCLRLQPDASMSRKLLAAGFKPRERRLTCDECGALVSAQMMPLHKCKVEPLPDHPPSRHCMCPACEPSFRDESDEPKTEPDELRICAMRVLIAWDGTVLPKSHDGLMQERMEDLRKVLAEQQQPTPVALTDAWQAIQTAPKDGTKIVLARGNAAHAGRWAESQYNGMWWMAGDYVAAFSRINPPTHWIPLPAPPVLAARADKQP